MKIKIQHDVFNIVNRIKQINAGYFVMFNTKNQKFEIHNKNYKNTLCLTLPFNQLDCRAIEYVLKSQNVEQMLAEIENNNLKIEKSNKEQLQDRTTYQLNEIYNYANKKVVDFDGNAYKFEWC